MSFQKNSLYACNPSTTRGAATKLSGTRDGRILYTNGKTVIVRDVNNPSLSLAYSGHIQPVSVARVSPSGFYCASADAYGNVRIWDTSFLKASSFPPTSAEPPILKAEYKPMSGRVVDLAWDGESKRIIVVGESRDRFGAAIQMDTGSSAGEISGHNKTVNAVSIRHQRPFKAVTASDDGTVIFLQGVPFKFEKAIKNHTRFVQDVQFSPNGDTFASVGSDSKAFLYDGKTGETKAELSDAHRGSIMAACWSPDSRSLVTSSADCTVKLWDVETGKTTTTWTLGSGISHQQVGNTWTGESPDVGVVSLSIGGDLNVFDKRIGDKPSKILYGSQKGITAAATVDGTFFAGSYDGRITAFDAQGNATRFEEDSGHGSQITGLASGGDTLFSVGFDDKLREIDVAKGTFTDKTFSLKSQPKSVAAFVNGPNTAFVITQSGIQAVENGAQVFNLPTSYQPSSVSTASDGHLVAVGGEDQKVYIYEWSGKELKEVAKLESNRAAVCALAFSPNGSVLAAGDSAGKVVAYDVKGRKMLTSRWAFHSARITSLAWTSDSKHCASGSLDTHVYVWSVAKPIKNIAIKNAVPGGVTVVAWVGAATVSGAGADGCVRTWDITFHQ